MTPITSHVLDTSLGARRKGLVVRVDRLEAGGSWTTMGEALTDDDGTGQRLPRRRAS